MKQCHPGQYRCEAGGQSPHRRHIQSACVRCSARDGQPDSQTARHRPSKLERRMRGRAWLTSRDLARVCRGRVRHRAEVRVIKWDGERGHGAVPGSQLPVERVPRRREGHHPVPTDERAGWQQQHHHHERERRDRAHHHHGQTSCAKSYRTNLLRNALSVVEKHPCAPPKATHHLRPSHPGPWMDPIHRWSVEQQTAGLNRSSHTVCPGLARPDIRGASDALELQGYSSMRRCSSSRTRWRATRRSSPS